MPTPEESAWERWNHYWLSRFGDTSQYGDFDAERSPYHELDWQEVTTTLRTVVLLTLLAAEEEPDWAGWWLQSFAPSYDGDGDDYESYLQEVAASYTDALNLLHAIRMHTYARNRIWDEPLPPTAAWLALTVFVHANDKARGLLGNLSEGTRERHDPKPVLAALPSTSSANA